MEQITVTCDSCGADLTTTGNSTDWRLALKSERIFGQGAVTDMYIPEPIDGPRHFCNLSCLRRWARDGGR